MKTTWGRGGLGVALVGVGILVAGCGGGGKSSSTTATSSSQGQTLKRWELRVKNGGTAQIPAPSFVERVAGLLGWPQIAEASTGIPGCNVSAPGPGGTVTAVTDANGKAILNNVTTPGVAHVSCAGVPGGEIDIKISGPPGSIIEVEVETNHGGLKVKAESEDASPSEPSISEPSPSPDRSGPNSGKG